MTIDQVTRGPLPQTARGAEGGPGVEPGFHRGQTSSHQAGQCLQGQDCHLLLLLLVLLVPLLGPEDVVFPAGERREKLQGELAGVRPPAPLLPALLLRLTLGASHLTLSALSGLT